MRRELEKTADGSSTLFVPELDEHYHSTKGAYTESLHVFVRMGLQASPARSPRVLEIGFGTGLNALLTLEESAKSQRNIHYTAIERYPLAWELIDTLAYRQQKPGELRAIHEAPWEKAVALTPVFTLRKVQADANQWLPTAPEGAFDVVYFDAFAPEKQPELWTQALFCRLYALLDEGGVLTTYCAKGVVRRMLQAAGFAIERLPGPPGGKREILRATRKGGKAAPPTTPNS